MLVLSRKQGDAVIINHNVRVVVIEARGDKVRLGFEAPREVAIHREEVEIAIQREQGAGTEPPKTAEPASIESLKAIALDAFASAQFNEETGRTDRLGAAVEAVVNALHRQNHSEQQPAQEQPDMPPTSLGRLVAALGYTGPKHQEFICPDCGAVKFGTHQLEPVHILQCHGLSSDAKTKAELGCGWRGTWQQVEEGKAKRAAIAAPAH